MQNKRIGIVLALVILLLTACAPTAIQTSVPPVKVYYAGVNGEKTGVVTALRLAQQSGTTLLVDEPAKADVLVLNGKIQDPGEFNRYVQAGKGLVLILGADVDVADLTVLLGAPITIQSDETPVSPVVDKNTLDSLIQDIVWTTATQVRQRLVANDPGWTPLVTAHETGDILLAQMKIGTGQAYIWTAFLDGVNPQFQEWPYFNYFIYHLVVQAAGKTPLRFGAYPASPVPHSRDRLILCLAMVVLLLAAWLIFQRVRRYSLAHPELLGRLVADRQEFEAREAGTDWEKIGFHRPIGGFMFALMSGLILFIPLTIYQDMILPAYILPSAQAFGIWGRITSFFGIIWGVFDMGTSVAHIKFFSQYRVHNPQKAVQYAQFFVWWQALSGAVQVALVTVIASTALPNTVYAIYIWSAIIHTLIQIPGFYMIISDNMTALQRFDYNQIIDMAANMVVPMITQPACILLVVFLSKQNPVLGGAMGGVFGLGVAAYMTAFVSFLVGLWLYRRIGYNARLLFLAHFDWAIVKQSLGYGIFLVLSGLIGGLGTGLNVLVIQNRLINMNEVLGNMSLAGSFSYAYTVLQVLYGNTMPSISEAISNGRRVLAQYYSAMGYKYGGVFSAFLAAMLLAVADRFILGASGIEFVRAASLTVPLLLSGAIGFAGLTGSIVMYGTNNTRYVTVLSAVGMVFNFVFAYLVVDRWQIYALIIPGVAWAIISAVAVYYFNSRYCYPQRFFPWQTLVAPTLAGVAHYLVLRWVTGLIWRQDEITSLVILVVALLPAYPLYAFFYGLFGGWDDQTLAEFGQGANLSAFMRPMARLFYRATALGAKFSLLHNKFPITIYQQARQEAQSLTEERVKLQ